MRFEEALKAMREGKTVKRKDYPFEFTIKEVLCVNGSCDYAKIEFNAIDIMSDKWELVE